MSGDRWSLSSVSATVCESLSALARVRRGPARFSCSISTLPPSLSSSFSRSLVDLLERQEAAVRPGKPEIVFTVYHLVVQLGVVSSLCVTSCVVPAECPAPAPATSASMPCPITPVPRHVSLARTNPPHRMISVSVLVRIQCRFSPIVLISACRAVWNARPRGVVAAVNAFFVKGYGAEGRGPDAPGSESPGETLAVPARARPFAPVGMTCNAGGRGFRSAPVTPVRLLDGVETTGPPTFLGNPGVPMPCSTTPAGPGASGPYDAPARPPLKPRRRLPRTATFEALSHGLGTRCLRFAGRIAPPPRKTRFRLLASSAGWDWIPTGFLRKVSEFTHVISSSFPKLSWRKVRLAPGLAVRVKQRTRTGGRHREADGPHRPIITATRRALTCSNFPRQIPNSPRVL